MEGIILVGMLGTRLVAIQQSAVDHSQHMVSLLPKPPTQAFVHNEQRHATRATKACCVN